MLVVLIAGALGSGKTTLLLKLAAKFRESGRRVAILENDVGRVPVDAPLLRERGFAVEDIPSGCICCDLASSLPTALTALRERLNPEVLLVEPSGLAAPGIVRGAIAGLLTRFDTLLSLYLMDMVRYGGGPVSPFFDKAMDTADIIVPTKETAAAPAALEKLHSQLRPEGTSSWGKPILSGDGTEVLDLKFLEEFAKPVKFTPWRKPPENPSNPRVGDPGAYTTYAGEFSLLWPSLRSHLEARHDLEFAVSLIRDAISQKEQCRIGTVKFSILQGSGTIISVSDDDMKPRTDSGGPWDTMPDRLVVNVIVYGLCADLETMVLRCLNKALPGLAPG